MEVTFEQLKDSKAYVSTGGVVFNTPEYYVNRFLETLGIEPESKNVVYKLQNKVENANTDGSINVSYGRLLTEAKLSFSNDYMNKTIGMVSAFDTGKPIIKVYSGARVISCTNLCISGADNLFSADILTNLESSYNILKEYKTNAEREWEESLKIWKNMQETIYSGSQISDKIGSMLEKVIKSSQFKSLGTSPISSAAKLLWGNESPYKVKDGETTGWNIYNSITQAITNSKEIITAPNKTVIATKLILS